MITFLLDQNVNKKSLADGCNREGSGYRVSSVCVSTVCLPGVVILRIIAGPMRFTFLQLSVFRDDWKELELDDDDLQSLERSLAEQPGAGRVIAGTGGLRKARLAPASWRVGKSNAVRVCYACFPEVNAIYLFAA